MEILFQKFEKNIKNLLQSTLKILKTFIKNFANFIVKIYKIILKFQFTINSINLKYIINIYINYNKLILGELMYFYWKISYFGNFLYTGSRQPGGPRLY